MQGGMPGDPYDPLLTPGSRNWSEIERCMDRARTMRAVYLYEWFARALGQAWRFLLSAASGGRALSRPLLALGLAAAALAVPTDVPRAQEQLQMSAGEQSGTGVLDGMALAELGLELGTIETCEDVGRLWHAVRELVLPGKVSVSTQQRILRRVWAIDPEIRIGSIVESATN